MGYRGGTRPRSKRHSKRGGGGGREEKGFVPYTTQDNEVTRRITHPQGRSSLHSKKKSASPEKRGVGKI